MRRSFYASMIAALLVLTSCSEFCVELCDQLLTREREEVRSFDLIEGCALTDLGSFDISGFSTTGFFEFASEEHNFTLPEDTLSYGIFIFGESSQSIGFEELITPAGTNYLQANSILSYLNLPIRPRFRSRFNGLIIPSHPSLSADPGEWAFRLGAFGATSAHVYLSVRTGSTPISTTLRIQPFLTGSTYSELDLTETFSRIQEIYQSIGVATSIENVSTISGDQFASVSSNFTDPTTEQLILLGLRTRINVFFVEDLTSTSGSTLGIAGSIPSPQGVKDPFNGVMVSMNAHLVNDVLDTDLLGETTVHEIGHWMGFYHTTEKDGESFDQFDDTPECDAKTYDVDEDEQLLPSECVNVGADNIMFWSASTAITQSQISPSQEHVIKYAPIACDE